MYSVNSSKPNTRYNIVCPLGKCRYNIVCPLGKYQYNIVCPLGKYQVQHCLPTGTIIHQCYCLYLFLTPSAQAMACCLGVRVWGLRLGDTRLFCPSLSMGREEEDCSPITVRSTCELISSSRNTCKFLNVVISPPTCDTNT